MTAIEDPAGEWLSLAGGGAMPQRGALEQNSAAQVGIHRNRKNKNNNNNNNNENNDFAIKICYSSTYCAVILTALVRELLPIAIAGCIAFDFC